MRYFRVQVSVFAMNVVLWSFLFVRDGSAPELLLVLLCGRGLVRLAEEWAHWVDLERRASALPSSQGSLPVEG